MPFTLPLDPEYPVDEFSCALDGSLYRFLAKWNGRAELWTLSILDAAGAPIIEGAPVQSGAPLFNVQRAALPPGRFVVVDTENTATDAGRYDLGARVQVVYFTRAELQELGQ